MKDKKDTKKFYDETSNSYDELYGDEQKEKYQHTFEVVSEVKGNVLDLGCGSGILEQYMKTEDDRLIFAFDFSVKLLTKAKQKLARRADLFLVCGDAERLPFRDEIFDFCFSFTLFQNLPNPHAAAFELKRVLKKDKNIVFTYLKQVATPKILKLFNNAEILDFAVLKEYIIKVKV